jgi:hypothetical protein
LLLSLGHEFQIPSGPLFPTMEQGHQIKLVWQLCYYFIVDNNKEETKK